MRTSLLLLGAALSVSPLCLRAQLVDLELSLLIDVSGSVSATEFNLQRQGYVDAFNSAAVQSTILSTANGHQGRIAANVIYWSGAGQQSEVVGWSLLDSAASIGAFASSIGSTLRPYQGNTAVGDALAFATPGFAANSFDAPRQVIDVSGDGATNSGGNTLTARNAALAAGVDTINGIIILGQSGLSTFYSNNVVGGTGGFLLTATGFDTFGTAIADKLKFEIGGGPVPEPSTYGAIGAAVLCGLVLWRRRSTKNPA